MVIHCCPCLGYSCINDTVHNENLLGSKFSEPTVEETFSGILHAIIYFTGRKYGIIYLQKEKLQDVCNRVAYEFLVSFRLLAFYAPTYIESIDRDIAKF